MSTRLYIVGRRQWEDMDRSGWKRFLHTLDNSSVVFLPDSKLERAYLPVLCNKCGAANMLIAEEFEPTDEEVREMGTEVSYSSQAYGSCNSCENELQATVDIWVYPPNQFQTFNVTEEIGCKASVVGNLDDLIDDIARAHEHEGK